jgi:RNA polymerase sigma-70 factor, ECF subfamily
MSELIDSARQAVEQTVKERLAAGDSVAAATHALESLGPEVLGFLTALMNGEEEAREVFAQFCEDFWVGLPRFEWRSSLRTWAYVLARHAMLRVRSDPHRDRGRRVPLSQSPEAQALEQQIRTRTPSYVRTEVKSELALLREALPEADRLLLVLRVDRDMSFAEIACITLAPEVASDEAAQQREVVRLRKRFQLVKEQLRELARERGLLRDEL